MATTNALIIFPMIFAGTVVAHAHNWTSPYTASVYGFRIQNLHTGRHDVVRKLVSLKPVLVASARLVETRPRKRFWKNKQKMANVI